MDFFRFRRSSEPSAPPELILAYMEEAQRLHAPCLAVDIKESAYPAVITRVEEEHVYLVVEGPMVVRQGGIVALQLFLDNLRFRAKAKVESRSGAELCLTLPHSLVLDERRARPRLTMKAHAVAHAVLMTGLFEGKSLLGVIENLSETGLRVQFTQAMSIRRQTAIPLVEDILVPGELLPVIRLEDLPRCPSVEVPGKVVYLQARMNKLYAGVAFDPGCEKLLLPVKEFLDSRTDPVPSFVPRKERLVAVQPAQPEPEPAPVLEQAVFARLPVGSDYHLRFKVAGVVFAGLPLEEISAGGCVWWVDRERAGAMPVGAVLKGLCIEHPDLPVVELSGQVIKAAPGDAADPESEVLVEAAFAMADPRVRTLLNQHVLRKLAQGGGRREPKESNVQMQYPRLSLPAGFTARFRYQGSAFTAIDVAEISAIGCLLHVPAAEARELQPGALLALFKFDHPELPSIPLQAQVIRIGAQSHHVKVEVAVEFVNLNERVRALIHGYVLLQIGCETEAGDAPMSYEPPTAEEEALHPTLKAGSDYGCSFRIGGVAFQDVGLTDLSAGGCGFQIEVPRSGPFSVGAFIPTFHLHHPELPQVTMQGCVSRVIGKVPGRTAGHVLVHIDFINLNDRMIRILQDHIARELGEEQP